MNNKYLFRVYHFNNKGNMHSPFVSGSEKGFGITEKANGLKDDVGNEFGSLWHRGKRYPKSNKHFGFSAFGKVDPRYSIFTEEMLDDDTYDAVQKEISSKVPESAHGQQTLKKYYADNEKDDFEFLSNQLYSPRERTSYLHKFNTGEDFSGANSFSISPEYFNFDSDYVWDDFVDDIDMYDTFRRLHPGMPDDGDRVVLATTPESSILSIDDVVKNGYTQQRDFPSELVTSEVTPIREFSEYPKAADNYFALRDKGASGPEAFGQSFKIAPTDIVSDANKKHIYKDLSTWYNKKNTQNNIINGIREFGQ